MEVHNPRWCHGTKMRHVHPPGTILQHMYLGERLARLPPGRFVEVGVGSGHVSQILLACGWTGVGYDLSRSALERASALNASFIRTGRYAVRNADWLDAVSEASDLVVSSMVIEHLKDEDVRRYFERSTSILRPGGRAILFVPGSPRHWGIEDEIAGHYRRYTVDSLSALVHQNGWRVLHITGLTYPFSNAMLGLSNTLVRRAERDRLALPLQQRTERSGDRHVGWKTEFPSWLDVVVNERTLWPLHWLQKRNSRNPNALVVYCECAPSYADVRAEPLTGRAAAVSQHTAA